MKNHVILFLKFIISIIEKDKGENGTKGMLSQC